MPFGDAEDHFAFAATEAVAVIMALLSWIQAECFRLALLDLDCGLVFWNLRFYLAFD